MSADRLLSRREILRDGAALLFGAVLLPKVDFAKAIVYKPEPGPVLPSIEELPRQQESVEMQIASQTTDIFYSIKPTNNELAANSNLFIGSEAVQIPTATPTATMTATINAEGAKNGVPVFENGSKLANLFSGNEQTYIIKEDGNTQYLNNINNYDQLLTAANRLKFVSLDLGNDNYSLAAQLVDNVSLPGTRIDNSGTVVASGNIAYNAGAIFFLNPDTGIWSIVNPDPNTSTVAAIVKVDSQFEQAYSHLEDNNTKQNIDIDMSGGFAAVTVDQTGVVQTLVTNDRGWGVSGIGNVNVLNDLVYADSAALNEYRDLPDDVKDMVRSGKLVYSNDFDGYVNSAGEIYRKQISSDQDAKHGWCVELARTSFLLIDKSGKQFNWTITLEREVDQMIGKTGLTKASFNTIFTERLQSFAKKYLDASQLDGNTLHITYAADYESDTNPGATQNYLDEISLLPNGATLDAIGFNVTDKAMYGRFFNGIKNYNLDMNTVENNIENNEGLTKAQIDQMGGVQFLLDESYFSQSIVMIMQMVAMGSDDPTVVAKNIISPSSEMTDIWSILDPSPNDFRQQLLISLS